MARFLVFAQGAGWRVVGPDASVDVVIRPGYERVMWALVCTVCGTGGCDHCDAVREWWREGTGNAG